MLQCCKVDLDVADVIFLYPIWTDNYYRVLDVAKIDFDVVDVNF
jgi:hypothetical protein